MLIGRDLTPKFQHMPRPSTAAAISPTAERMRIPVEAEQHEKDNAGFSDVINNEIRVAPEANERGKKNLTGAIGERTV